jgi:hypothetical protein
MERDDRKGPGDPRRNLHICYICIYTFVLILALGGIYLTGYSILNTNIPKDYFPYSVIGIVFSFVLGVVGTIIMSLLIHGEISELNTLKRLR